MSGYRLAHLVSSCRRASNHSFSFSRRFIHGSSWWYGTGILHPFQVFLKCFHGSGQCHHIGHTVTNRKSVSSINPCQCALARCESVLWPRVWCTAQCRLPISSVRYTRISQVVHGGAARYVNSEHTVSELVVRRDFTFCFRFSIVSRFCVLLRILPTCLWRDKFRPQLAKVRLLSPKATLDHQLRKKNMRHPQT